MHNSNEGKAKTWDSQCMVFIFITTVQFVLCHSWQMLLPTGQWGIVNVNVWHAAIVS